MELALASLATLGGEAIAAGGAAVAANSLGGALATSAGASMAAGGGLLSSFFSSPVLSILTGATSAVSAIQSLQQGNLKAQDAEFKAAVTRNEAMGAQAEGLAKKSAINRELLKTLGEDDVAYAASGVDLGSGAAAGARSHAISLAADEASMNDASTRARVTGYEAQALNYDRMSRQYRSGAMLGALASFGGTLISAAKRG